MTTVGIALPLTALAPGECGKLAEIQGGHALHKRLADLGLTVGTLVRVVNGDPCGALILAFKDDARLAIGRGVAQKIFVVVQQGA